MCGYNLITTKLKRPIFRNSCSSIRARIHFFFLSQRQNLCPMQTRKNSSSYDQISKNLEIKILQQIKVRPFCQSLYFHLTNNLRSKHFLLLHTRGVKLDISVWQPTVDNCCPRGFGDLVVR